MALSLTCTRGGTSSNYTKYLSGTINKSDRANEPDLLDFTLSDFGDAGFVKLQRGDYIKFQTVTYGMWFTGFITNDPSPVFLGRNSAGQPKWEYHYQATSDDFLLNMQTVGIIRPYINTTQGAIIKDLVSILDKFGRFQTSITNLCLWSQQLDNAAWSKSTYTISANNTTAPDNTTTADKITTTTASGYVRQQVTVTANTTHTFSWWAKSGTSTSAKYSVYNVTGAADIVATTSYTLSSDWTRYSVTFTTPVGCTSVYIYASRDNQVAGDYYWWGGQLEARSYASTYAGETTSSTTVSTVRNGVTVAQYDVDPNQKFGEIVKDFADPYYYRFWVRDSIVYYMPADAEPFSVIVDGNNTHFSPDKLDVSTRTEQITNDVVVVGDVEPQGYINEYRLGDGFTAAFDLLSGVFGVGSSVILDEEFSGNYIDLAKWTVVGDSLGTYFQVSNNYLNSLTGPANSTLSAYVQAINPIPLEGNIRITHGEWDFINSGPANDVAGVIAGLWTQAPNISLTGCMYGIRVYRDGSGISLRPIVNGTLQPNSGQTALVAIDTSKRYIIRTIVSATRRYRYEDTQSYISSSGTVGTYGDNAYDDVLMFNTFIAQIDPSTGKVTNTYTFLNTSTTVSSSALSAFYVPIASNDLHATVSNITISRPLDVVLEHQPWATFSTTSWLNKFVGPNEIDSFDGAAAVATVVQDNNGVQRVSADYDSYNPAHAQLVYFKDSSNLVSYLPDAATIIHFKYRRAGAAMGRVYDPTSILTEAAQWGDVGRRAIVINGLDPLPRTSGDCEIAAAAYLQGNLYQHYQGTYVVPSNILNGEPLAGTILKFRNMNSTAFPNIGAEYVDSVDTSFVSNNPGELYMHTIGFGGGDYTKRLLPEVNNNKGSKLPQDTASVPDYISTSAVEVAYAADVVAAYLQSWNSTNVTYNTGQAPPSGGGFEVRYTDSGWGSSDGKNLIVRTTGSTQTFTVPRTANGRTCFVRAYDTRNKINYSEDITNAAWTKDGGTAALVSGLDPNGNTSILSQFTPTSGNKRFYQMTGFSPSSSTYTGVVYVKGTVGKIITLQLSNNVDDSASVNKTLDGTWQKVSLTKTFNSTAGNLLMSVAANDLTAFKATFVSLENSSVDTVYCKTLSTAYGVTSRFSAGLRAWLPLIPSAPTATITYTDYTSLTVTVVPPATMSDVWGYEIRASDNSTVLYKKNLVDVTFSSTLTVANTSTTPSFYVYSYNLLGEYSSSYNATTTIPSPTVSYGGTFTATTSGVIYLVTPTTSDTISKYEAVWTVNSASVPAASVTPYWSGTVPVGSAFSVFAGGTPGQVIRMYLRAVMASSGYKQTWTSVDSGITIVTVGAAVGDLDSIADGASGKKMTAANTSYRPLSNPLTGADTGSVPRITIAAFTMRIAGVGDISIGGGSVDGTSGDYGKTGYIYFDDATFASGTFSFNMTFVRETALIGGGRFFVGSIQLPLSSGGGTVGNNDGGTGAQYARSFILLPSTATNSGFNNPLFAYDENMSNYADATTSSSPASMVFSGFPAYFQLFSSTTLKVKHQLDSITGSGATALVETSTDGGTNWSTLRAITAADGAPVISSKTLTPSQKTDKVQVRVTLPGGGGTNSTSPTTGATAADDAAVGTVAWSTGSGSGTAASTTGTSTKTTHYLKITNFGFAVSGTIVGISASVTKRGTYAEDGGGTPTNSVQDSAIYIIKGGTVMTATNLANAGVNWPGVDTAVVYGGSSSLWGQTWTSTDINASTFGVAISAAMFRNIGSTTCAVSSVQITIYTSGASATASGKIHAVTMEVTI